MAQGDDVNDKDRVGGGCGGDKDHDDDDDDDDDLGGDNAAAAAGAAEKAVFHSSTVAISFTSHELGTHLKPQRVEEMCINSLIPTSPVDLLSQDSNARAEHLPDDPGVHIGSSLEIKNYLKYIASTRYQASFF
ncbi:hypothetical protein ElyMa_001716700 [Elysia marginata]|uniref:Uncharacterized protein n=1 Tax=Elysia marginata TaxID=1093978 RepID=A0AAV4JVL7_9GAST|nr:hypothetical protein ElyMa_001716700 [Elysia marginata]